MIGLLFLFVSFKAALAKLWHSKSPRFNNPFTTYLSIIPALVSVSILSYWG